MSVIGTYSMLTVLDDAIAKSPTLEKDLLSVTIGKKISIS